MQIRVTFVFNKLFSRHREFKTDFLVNEYEVKLFFESDRASGNPRGQLLKQLKAKLLVNGRDSNKTAEIFKNSATFLILTCFAVHPSSSF